MKEKQTHPEVGEDATQYGEFVSSYFAWIPLPEQKEKAEELAKITKTAKTEPAPNCSRAKREPAPNGANQNEPKWNRHQMAKKPKRNRYQMACEQKENRYQIERW